MRQGQSASCSFLSFSGKNNLINVNNIESISGATFIIGFIMYMYLFRNMSALLTSMWNTMFIQRFFFTLYVFFMFWKLLSFQLQKEHRNSITQSVQCLDATDIKLDLHIWYEMWHDMKMYLFILFFVPFHDMNSRFIGWIPKI